MLQSFLPSDAILVTISFTNIPLTSTTLWRTTTSSEKYKVAATIIPKETCPKILNFPANPCLSFRKYFDVIIGKPNQTKPNRGNDHQDNINIIEPGKQKRRNKDGSQNNNSTHCRCTFFLHLAFAVPGRELLRQFVCVVKI